MHSIVGASGQVGSAFIRKKLNVSEDGIRNFIEMTEAVINEKIQSEGMNVIKKCGNTTLHDSMTNAVPNSTPRYSFDDVTEFRL